MTIRTTLGDVLRHLVNVAPALSETNRAEFLAVIDEAFPPQQAEAEAEQAPAQAPPAPVAAAASPVSATGAGFTGNMAVKQPAEAAPVPGFSAAELRRLADAAQAYEDMHPVPEAAAESSAEGTPAEQAPSSPSSSSS
jgi:hypothetical protein